MHAGVFSFEHHCFDLELEVVRIVFESASDAVLVFRSTALIGVQTESKEGFLHFLRRDYECAF